MWKMPAKESLLPIWAKASNWRVLFVTSMHADFKLGGRPQHINNVKRVHKSNDS
jgi:hypothetical protein